MDDSSTIIYHEIDPNPWRLGVIYADSNDDRLIVPQRLGIGWTLNFARPSAWLLTAFFLAAIFFLKRR